MEKPELSILRIDEEFLRLTSCETDQIMDLLEHEMTTMGQIPIIYVWRGYIVDGHKRYSLCHQCNVPFYVRVLQFKSKVEVLSWRCSQLISEKSCHTNKFFHYYVGKYYVIEHARIGAGKRPGHNQFTPRDELISTGKVPTYKEIAEIVALEAGVKIPSVLKYSREYKYFESIYDMSPLVAKLILEERILASYETLGELAKFTPFEMNRAERYLQTLPYSYINMNKLNKHIGAHQNYDIPKTTRRKPKPQVDIKPQIKITPQYDPDAEVSSLALTIPSWISSINRTRKNVNFHAITDNARDKLRSELGQMIYSIRLLLNELEVPTDER